MVRLASQQTSDAGLRAGEDSFDGVLSAKVRSGHRQLHLRHSFQSVFVMESAQDRRTRDTMAGGQTMAMRLLGTPLQHWLRNTRSETRVWPSTIVMSDPFLKDLAKMTLTEWEQPIQALSAKWCRSRVRNERWLEATARAFSIPSDQHSSASHQMPRVRKLSRS